MIPQGEGIGRRNGPAGEPLPPAGRYRLFLACLCQGRPLFSWRPRAEPGSVVALPFRYEMEQADEQRGLLGAVGTTVWYGAVTAAGRC